MKKQIAFVLAMLMLGGLAVGCSGSKDSSAAPEPDSTPASQDTSGEKPAAAEGQSFKIGCTFDYLSDFMAYVTDGVIAYGEEHKEVEVTVQDANFDVAKQLQQVENFINGGYDAVVIKPVDSEGCQQISQACVEAGVPLVVVNTEISGSDYDTYIGSNHQLSGRLQAEFVAEKLDGKGKVAILQGDLKTAATGQRTDGNKQVFAEYPDIEIVSEQEAMWMRDEAMNKTENWLNSDLEIDAIVANNDEMALGAALVLKEAGITDVLICGIDASEEALNALKDGLMAMTVFQNGYAQGYEGVAAAVKILNGETLEKYIDVPYEVVLPEQADEYLAIVTGK